MQGLCPWHTDRVSEIEAPLEDKPVWLGRLLSEQRLSCKALVSDQRLVPLGVQYAESLYRLCGDYGVSFQELAELTDKSPIAFVAFRAAKPTQRKEKK